MKTASAKHTAYLIEIIRAPYVTNGLEGPDLPINRTGSPLSLSQKWIATLDDETAAIAEYERLASNPATLNLLLVKWEGSKPLQPGSVSTRNCAGFPAFPLETPLRYGYRPYRATQNGNGREIMETKDFVEESSLPLPREAGHAGSTWTMKPVRA